MANYGYVKIKAGGSDVEGSCTDKNFEKQMVVYKFDMTCFFNFDDVQGRTTSNQHGSPVGFVIKLDESAPELLKAFRKANPCEVLWTIVDKDKNGAQVPIFTIKLINARIVKWNVFTPHTKDPATQVLDHSLEVSFSYEQVDVTAEKWDSTSKGHPKKMDTFKFREPTA
jgi:type VI secretion system Hcp family effector